MSDYFSSIVSYALCASLAFACGTGHPTDKVRKEIYNDGYKSGYSVAEERTYDEAYRDGYSDGYTKAYPSASLASVSAPKATEQVVYVTDTGSKYHKPNCSYLKSKREITLKDAISNGYTPCSRCY